jgi:transposase InsO family protein
LHDRDTKFRATFDSLLKAGGVNAVKLPPKSPNLNAFAKRWVRSVKEECLSRLVLFGEASLKRAAAEYVQHYHSERPHQGKGNLLLFPKQNRSQPQRRRIVRKQRLGGLLNYYSGAA